MNPIKTELVRFRIDPVHKRELVRAAQLENLDVSSWIRRLAIAEARKSLRRKRERK